MNIIPVLTIVVSSYARFDCITKLVESARRVFPQDYYEIIAVCSDDPESFKARWLKEQHDVKYVQADVRQEHRSKSLYYYENIGIKMAQGEWVIVTNDDTEFDAKFYDEFSIQQEAWDVMVIAGHLGDVGLGCRTAIIGTITPPGEPTRSLYLYDFTAIRWSVYQKIGFLDDGLDWFGKGFDLAMACETCPGIRITVSNDIKINHTMEAENRRPPHYASDFNFATEKWKKWCEKSGWSFTWPW